jgi:chemosensory pili system protein ChpE
MLTLVLSSVALAIAFCAPPGVVTAEAVRRGLARGYWPALLVGLGSLIGDATWAILALAGAAFIVQNVVARLLLGLVGTLFLLYLAWGALRDAAQNTSVPQSNRAAARGDFTAGALLSLSNPFAIAFWLGVSGSVVTASVADPQPIHFVVFFLSFMSGGLAWAVFLSGLIAGGRRFLTTGFFRWVNVLCGLSLGYFGLELFLKTVQGLA